MAAKPPIEDLGISNMELLEENNSECYEAIVDALIAFARHVAHPLREDDFSHFAVIALPELVEDTSLEHCINLLRKCAHNHPNHFSYDATGFSLTEDDDAEPTQDTREDFPERERGKVPQNQTHAELQSLQPKQNMMERLNVSLLKTLDSLDALDIKENNPEMIEFEIGVAKAKCEVAKRLLEGQRTVVEITKLAMSAGITESQNSPVFEALARKKET